MAHKYTLRDFDFTLPKELIAQTPAHPRDHAKLLVYNRTDKSIVDDYFYNLEKYLSSNTTVVVNNSKVEKCRLRFGKIEIFVIETINPTTIQALVYPGKKFKIGTSEINNFCFTITAIAENGIRTISLDRPLDDKSFDEYRLTPLPPYITQDESLAEEYQTIYAKPLGSKAAPTAGLHFTPELLMSVRANHPVAEVTLHVGMGTFAPVKLNNLSLHKMHEERFTITTEVAKLLNIAKHVTAVGTTSMRVLESIERPYTQIESTTDIFITPGYNFKNADALITNFHLPKSTLLMLVSAFIGSVPELHRIYDHAIKENYRFYSFGDAMLIL
jgi:S-adenosylmethionine:tRNA ribosyltransferase-isomerase